MFTVPNTGPHGHVSPFPRRPIHLFPISQSQRAATNAQSTRTALPKRSTDLVANANEVVGESLDRLGCVARDDILSVMRDNDSLFGLGDHDTVLAL